MRLGPSSADQYRSLAESKKCYCPLAPYGRAARRRRETREEETPVATATTNGSKVIKPDHGAERKHMIFTQEHEDLRESMQAWVQKELWPHRNEWEETTWPDDVLKRAGDLGFLGLCFPEEYGGQGGDYYYSLVRAECMSYSGSGGLNMGFVVHTDMVLPPIELLGTEALKKRYTPSAIAGDRLRWLGSTH